MISIARRSPPSELREANVWSYEQVISVVLETTGDVSVLHRSVQDATLSDAIFADVRGGLIKPTLNAATRLTGSRARPGFQ